MKIIYIIILISIVIGIIYFILKYKKKNNKNNKIETEASEDIPLSENGKKILNKLFKDHFN